MWEGLKESTDRTWSFWSSLCPPASDAAVDECQNSINPVDSAFSRVHFHVLLERFCGFRELCSGTVWFRVLSIKQNSLNMYLRGGFSLSTSQISYHVWEALFLIFFKPRHTEPWGHCAVYMAWSTRSALAFCYVSHIKAEETWWKCVLVLCIGRKWNAM